MARTRRRVSLVVVAAKLIWRAVPWGRSFTIVDASSLCRTLGNGYGSPCRRVEIRHGALGKGKGKGKSEGASASMLCAVCVRKKNGASSQVAHPTRFRKLGLK